LWGFVFIISFFGSILLFLNSLIFNFKINYIKKIANKHLIYLILQLIFCTQLIYWGVYIYEKGTAMNFDTPNLIYKYYPEPMIFAIIITVITLFQLIHFIYILRKELKKQNFRR
jgi:hypothetical protein